MAAVDTEPITGINAAPIAEANHTKADLTCPSSSWFAWRPTSIQHLEHYEQRMLEPVRATRRQEFVDIGDGNKLNTIILNEEDTHKPVLVMMHGFGGGVGIWTKNLEHLAEHYRVFAFDTLGFGRSSRPAFPQDPDQVEAKLVDSIERWRIQVGLEEPFHLLGHSFGGYQAGCYALKYPENVNHLVFADPWGFPVRPEEDINRKRPLWVRAIVGVMSALGSPMSLMRGVGPLGPRLLKRVRGDLGQKFVEVHEPETTLSYFYHLNAQTPSGEHAFFRLALPYGWARKPMIERVSGVDPNIPVSFLYGSKSWMDSNAGQEAARIRSECPGRVQNFVVDNSGHHIYADNHEQFNQYVAGLSEEARVRTADL